MFDVTRRTLGTVALAAAFLLPTGVLAQDSAAEGPIILTVTGKLNAPTRQAYSEEDDKFFGYYEVDFDQAAQFDYDKLRALDLHSVQADFPKGGPVHTFEGPLLADVLKAAGAEGKTVTVLALDGYGIEAPLQELVDQGAVVALRRNGTPFAIGDYGPTQIVFPRAERDDLADMPDDHWVWSIFHISVE